MSPPGAVPRRLHHAAGIQWQRMREGGIVGLLFICASVATLATAAIFLTLLVNGTDFFAHVGLREFLFGAEWRPDHPPRSYGSLPLLKGTFQIAVGAVAIGLPLGVASALFVSEFASPRLRRILKPTLELLAGVPSIVFGLIALFILAPIVKDLFPQAGEFTALSASVALGVMVVPIIAAISEDALRAVPQELREAALALGSNRWETTWKVVLPAARSGVSAAVILGFSRAIGETMVVTMAAGLVPNLNWSYLEPVQTMTAFMANRAAGDLPVGQPEYLAIFALGLLLFTITFAINLVAELVLARQRRRLA